MGEFCYTGSYTESVHHVHQNKGIYIGENGALKMVDLVDGIWGKYMEQEKNPVLDFNWKTDLEECVPANRYYSIMKHQTSLSDGTPWGIIYDTQPLFQRDEKESIKLQGDGYPEVEIPTNVWTWRRSLDKYLYQYFLLIDSKSMDQTESDWVAIKLTDEIVKKLDNYEEAKKRGRARKLPVDPIFLHYLTGDERVKYDGVDYRTPRYFRACYLNQLFRGLATDSTATTSLLAPQQDGVAFWKDDKGEYPRFEIEDYWLHEKITGISLTIEIASVFLEVRGRGKDDEMWNKALETFIRKALPTIVRSPLFFTRNTVARRFFQEIATERSMPSNQWNLEDICNWRDDNYWNDFIERAISYLNVLIPNAEVYSLPLSQVDEAIFHIHKLLSALELPVNIPKYVNNPNRGLALFCDTRHERVSYFTDRLYTSKNDSIRLTDNSKLSTFARIRKAVKDAISFVGLIERMKNVSFEFDEAKETQIKETGTIVVITYRDSVPHEMWEFYKKYANTKGGTILLTRFLGYKFDLEWSNGKNNKVIWVRDASDIVEDIWEMVNNPKIISKNILSRESLKIWEYLGWEIIEITVPPKTDNITVQINPLEPNLVERE